MVDRFRKDIGDRAERIVARWLEDQGALILARNMRLSYLELDIVAREKDVVVIVEVRARGEGAWTSPFSSIGGKKKMHLRHAAERLWDRRFKRDPTVSRIRIDVASVQIRGEEIRLEYARSAL